MRDKVLTLIALTLRPVDQRVSDLVAQAQNIHSLGQVPSEFKEVSTLIAATFEPRKVKLEDAFVEVYAKYFTEEEVNQLLAIYNQPVFAKTASVINDILDDLSVAEQSWASETMSAIEPELQRLLGSPGAQSAQELPEEPSVVVENDPPPAA